MTKKTMITSGVIVFAVLILIFIFLLMLGSNEVDSPATTPIEATTKNNNETIVDNNTEEIESPDNSIPEEIAEPSETRIISGVVQEVNSSSIVVSDVKTEKDIEISFDSSTEIFRVEGKGKNPTSTDEDIVVDQNIAVFLSTDKAGDFAQKILILSANQQIAF